MLWWRAPRPRASISRHAVTTFVSRADGIDVTLGDGSVIEASLLVAADGARSKLRERAGIATHGWDYDQSGIVVTVGHERDHTAAPKSISFPPDPLDIAVERKALVDRVDENRAEAARINGARMTKNFTANSKSGSGCISARSSRWDKPRAFPLGLFRGALLL